MKYIILIIIIFLLILLFLLINYKKRIAKQEANKDTLNEKLESINKVLNPFGFMYDLKEDIIISKNNSWQREFGYMDLYDLKAPLFNMVMDIEPIYFFYNNKHYRIEFWKGQYGITCGAEVGIYVRDFNSNLPNGVYRSATDEERLDISFILYNDCYLFSRRNYTWWLAGFNIGTFSKPKDLKMKISIIFPNKEMEMQFINGLKASGYKETNIKVNNLEVTINFCKPKNYKLNKKSFIIKHISQINNRINCSIYNYITKDFNTTLDKLNYLKHLTPFLYKIIVNKCIICKKK